MLSTLDNWPLRNYNLVTC